MLKSNFYFIQRIVLRGATVLITVLVLVAGCAPLGGIRDSDNSTILDRSGALVRNSKPAQADPILAFVGSAPAAGRTGRFELPGETGSVLVRVGRVYESASGHACRRYHLPASEGSPTRSSHLACRDTDGRWFQSRPLVNPDSLDGSESRTLRVGKP